MRRIAIGVLVVAAGTCTAAFTHGSHRATSFRLPDASAACRLEGTALECANLRVRSALVLPGHGGPHAVDAHVWWDASTPVLEHWRAAGLTCREAGGAILCRNATGATISIGAGQLAVGL